MQELLLDLIDVPYLRLLVVSALLLLGEFGLIVFRNNLHPNLSKGCLIPLVASLASVVLFVVMAYLFPYTADWILFVVCLLLPTWLIYQAAIYVNRPASSNSKDPSIGDFVNQALVEPFRRGYRTKDKSFVFILVLVILLTGVVRWLEKQVENDNFFVYVAPQFVGTSEEDTDLAEMLEIILKSRLPVSSDTIKVGTLELDKRRADLELVLKLVGFETCDSSQGPEALWDWSSPRADLQRILNVYLEGAARNSPERGKTICRWTQTGDYFAALVAFVHGLNLYYVENDDPHLAEKSFRAAIREIENVTDEIDLTDEDLVWLPRQIMSCALVLGTLAGDDIASESAMVDLERAQNPFKEATQPNGYCIARAHYLMGRALLEQYNDLLSPQERHDTLQAANGMFSRAITIQRQVDPSSEQLIDYQFYRALVHYRQGQFQLALDELDEIDVVHAHRQADPNERLMGSLQGESPELNDVSFSMAVYFRERIGLEAFLYQELLSEACPPISQPVSGSLEERLDALVSTGLSAPAENWLSEARLQSLPHYHAARYYLTEGDGASHKVLDHAEEALKLSGPDKTPGFDILLSTLYENAENLLAAEELRDQSDVDRFLQIEAAPAYVLTFSPILEPVLEGCRSNNPYRVLDKPVVFRWAIRNQFDEPVFEDSSVEVAYRVEMNGEDTGSRVREIGYGLFESEPVDSFVGSFEAVRRNDGFVLLGSQSVALIYDTPLGNQTVPAGVYNMSISGEVQTSPAEGYVTEEQSIVADIEVKLTAAHTSEVIELSVRDIEIVVVPVRRALPAAVSSVGHVGATANPWKKIAEEATITVRQQGVTPVFGGRLEFMPPEQPSAYDYGLIVTLVGTSGRPFFQRVVPIEGVEWPR